MVMTKLRFASQSALMEWANTTHHYCYRLDTVLVVPIDGLFYYFSLDADRWYDLVMSSQRNLAERE